MLLARLTIALVLLASALSCGSHQSRDETPKIPEYGARIINRFPHDRAAFTQGLEIVDGQLYEGTGHEGTSWLRRVELETGNVLQQYDLADSLFGEGITILGDRIYQLTWLHGICFVFDRETFDSLGFFRYNTQGWGLTHDDSLLIMSDGSSTVYFRDPQTFQIRRRITAHDHIGQVAQLNELEYIDGEIWANVYTWNFIARISPTDGQILGWIRLADLAAAQDSVPAEGVLNGIAYDHDQGRLFVTGKYWPSLYEIELVPVER